MSRKYNSLAVAIRQGTKMGGWILDSCNRIVHGVLILAVHVSWLLRSGCCLLWFYCIKLLEKSSNCNYLYQ